MFDVVAAAYACAVAGSGRVLAKLERTADKHTSLR
jgi:hypothetical protein